MRVLRYLKVLKSLDDKALLYITEMGQNYQLPYRRQSHHYQGRFGPRFDLLFKQLMQIK